MVDTKDIIQNMKSLGLEEPEASVYLYIFYNGISSVWEVSKAINIPRSTVYRICEDLILKRFAERVVDDKGFKVKAVQPERLGFLVEEKRTELDETSRTLSFLQNTLKVNADDLPKTQVRYYQGKEGIKQIMWNALKADREVVGYSVFGRIEVVGKAFIDKYNLEFAKRKLLDRVIIGPDQVERLWEFSKKGSLHKTSKNVRVIEDYPFYVSGDTMLYNNIYAVSYWKEGEVVGVEIENAEVVKLHKSIFEILWKISKTL